jgi:hypothetical protein
MSCWLGRGPGEFSGGMLPSRMRGRRASMLCRAGSPALALRARPCRRCSSCRLAPPRGSARGRDKHRN